MKSARPALAMSVIAFSAIGLLAGSGGCGGTTGTEESADATSDAPVIVIVPHDGSPPIVDAGDANATTDAPIDYGDGGHCSPVNGACDVVLNNCPAMDGLPAECLPFDTAGSSTCTTERPSQHLPLGHTCCPPLKTETDDNDASFLAYDTNNEPCLPGLQCNGDPCTDAGATARCSPRCCDDSVCGKSVPEGIVGSCDLNIVDDNENMLYSICTYQRPCRPFGVTPCPAGQVCLVSDHLGTATCSSTFFPDGGNGAENAGCNAANSCADGLGCILFDVPTGDGGDPDADVTEGFCQYFCAVPGITPPFDAGSSGAPGYGGCPAGEICNQLDQTSDPAWLGYCAPQ